MVDDQCSHFNSIELLKSRPTHLLVFIHHVMLQFDCAPVLCYLHADLFKNFNAKDTKKHFGEFYNTFLEKGAILKVPMPNTIASELGEPWVTSTHLSLVSNYDTGLPVLFPHIRQKRMMGMTPNERELNDVESHRPTDRIPMEMKEKAVAESLLEKMVESNNCVFGAVAFYMKHLGVKTRALDNKKTKSGWRNVRRSESLCVERRHSRRSGSTRAKQSRSRSDVDLQSTSTSHPLSPSPQHSVSLVTGPDFGPFPQQEEMEPRLLELEQDPPNWRGLASHEDLKKLNKKEIKRQEVINELFTTEHAHVRMLSVLQTVFSRPLEKEEIMSITELATIFPNLDEIIEMHYAFYENLKKLRQEDEYIVKIISTPLLNRFSGSEGEWFQKLTARFCSHQSWALEQIKSKQKKDARFNAFILEAESKPQCRRLQLKDIIPIEMQRLTKYPLLLENIAKNTDDETEKENINQAAESCRKILNHVNEEVKLMENLLILKDYQRRLDTSGLKPSNDLYSEYKNIDLTSRRMLFEGPLTWRVTKEKAIDVHCILLSDLLVLVQKQDDKMVLKCQSKSNIAVQEGKQMLSPIIKLESVFLRDVATDPKALYVIFTWDSGAQIYELVAQTLGEKKKLLIGSISLSDDSQTLGENGGTAPESQEADGGQSSGTAHILLQVFS
uniref:Rho guanine nucleotide exchange factor (GEF) 1 n=1 Tax=Cyprinus carpio carpio TaxID=630221 RepID=A0A8C1ABZ4_CYPCA